MDPAQTQRIHELFRLEDQIERLGVGGEETEMAKQELLIAKGDAVPMLLEALENPEFAAGRAELADVLVGLMTRVDDGRIDSSLKAHLVSDPDSETRVRIAREIGILKRPDFADSFVRAVDDEDGQVRGEALTALCLIREELEPELLIVLSEKARLLRNDENDDARLGALIIVADRVDLWLTEADNEALKGRLAAAESLYHEALAYAPDSKKANLKLGHYLFENGQEDRGLQLLRDSGWLLDVPVSRSLPSSTAVSTMRFGVGRANSVPSSPGAVITSPSPPKFTPRCMPATPVMRSTWRRDAWMRIQKA